MTVTARFIRGNKTIDIVYPYSLSGFVPPSVRPDYNITTGTSANKTGGGELVGLKYNNRSISFGVRVLGTSRSQMETSVRKLQAFLAGATGEVTYFEYRDNTLPVPLYGQFGASLRYEIVTAETYYNNEYQSDLQRSSGLTLGISLVVKPFALGSRQQLATASGGVTEDILGTADGTSRGLMVLDATTNKMTNPVWGSATWNTGWLAEANLIIAQNTNLDFVYPGAKNSAALTSKAAGRKFYQSINVGNTNAHYLTAYVVKPDRSAVTSADVILYYGGNKTTTYTHMGNGVYQLSAGVTGVGAGTATGVSVSAGKSIYLLGMQIEERAYPTALVFGDQLGSAWTGTAHASTSSRAAGRVTVPSSKVYRADQGTIAWVVKMPMASTLMPTWVFFDMAGVQFRAYWQLSDTKFYFSDGTNLITSAVKTFAAGEVLVMHATWNSAGLKLYLGGVEIATGATYTIPTTGATFDIGRDEAGLVGSGAVMGMTFYDTAMTAAQVAASYAAIAPVAAADLRVDYIPWLWTKDGDNQVDNCDDSTRDNWCAVGGVPGNAQAQAIFEISPSAAKDGYYFGGTNFDYKDFVIPTSQWYSEQSGTADANSSGGAYKAMTAGADNFTALSTTKPAVFYEKMNFFARMRTQVGSANITVYPALLYGANSYINGSAVTLAGTTTMTLYYLGMINSKGKNRLSAQFANDKALSIVVLSTTNIYGDFYMIIPGDVIKIPWSTGYGSLSKFVISEGEIVSYDTSGFRYTDTVLLGNMPALTPDRLNMLWWISGAETDSHVITETATIQIYLNPRWGLL